MMNFKTYFFPLLSIIVLFILSGCKTIEVRGQFISDKEIEAVKLKKPSKEAVIEMIGTPTYVPSFSTNTWYYMQRSLSKRAWFNPKVVEQRIIKIVFNKNNKVNEAIVLMDMHNENVDFHSDYTKTSGTEQNGIQKFVKNMGRFNPTTDGRKKRTKKK